MFEPWQGDLYGQFDNAISGVRLMILGESHYSDRPEHPVGSTDPGMTKWVVDHYLKGELGVGHRRTLTKMGAIVAHKQPSQMSITEREAIWHSVIFYNYIPVIAAANYSQPIPEHLWHGRAVEAFRYVIRKHEVEAILVCGLRLWQGMGCAMPEEVNGWANTRRYRTYGDFMAVATFMHHPAARGWSFDHWRDRADYLYAEVTAERERNGHPALGIAADTRCSAWPGTRARRP
jgi:hypothetical protein